MGDQQAGIALLLPQSDQLPLHADAGKGIELAQRLVEQQQTRLIQQRPGQRRTLRHPAGKLARPRFAKRLQPHSRNQRIGLWLKPLFPLRLRSQQHVLPHRQPRIKGRILKHQYPFGPRSAHRRLINLNLPGLLRLQSRQQPQQSGFTAARRTEQRDALSGPQLQADILQHRHRLFAKAKSVMQMAYRHRRAGRCRLRSGVRGYHCIPPRCQLSSRSRTINSPLIRPEQSSAITSSAAYILG